MPVTLPYGIVQPQDGDRGSTFWDDLADDLARIDNHSHNDVDSVALGPGSLISQVQDIVSGSWVLVANNVYRQLVTMPGSLQFDNVSIQAFINSGSFSGNMYFPTILRASANTFYIYINDNTLDVRIKYK